MERRVKILAGAIITFLFAALIVFFWIENREARKLEALSIQMEEELRPLNVQKDRLRRALNSLERDDLAESKGIGSIVLLFTDLNQNIYTDIYPQMEAYGFTGVFALSSGQLPGQAGCLSKVQFDKLLDAGWEYCLSWDKDMTFEEWLESAGTLALEAGIDLPEAVYFQEGTYRSELDGVLFEAGFLTAVHHGEDGISLISSGLEKNIWRPGAMPWSQSNSPGMLSEIISQGGNLIFTIGSDSPEEEYVEETFSVMLEEINQSCETDQIFVAGLQEIREYRKRLGDGTENLETDYMKQRSDLEKQIENLDREIDDITNKYILISRKNYTYVNFCSKIKGLTDSCV